MKKIVIPILLCLLVFSTGSVYAADEYSFGLEYTGTLEVGVEKEAAVTLTGVNGPAYTNVRIKVDIEGPATPKLLAYDTNGTEFDIAELGYWGPASGFAVQGSFTNRTPVRATFTKAGEYKVTLSLIDIANSDNVITTKTIVLQVSDVEDNTNNNGTNNDNGQEGERVEQIVEIPKAGLGFDEMTVIFAIIVSIGIGGYLVYQKKIKV